MSETVQEIYDLINVTPVFKDGKIISVVGNKKISFELGYSHDDSKTEKKVTSIEHLSMDPQALFPLETTVKGQDGSFRTVDEDSVYLWSSPVLENPVVKATSYSPTGQYKVMFMEGKKDGDKEKRWIELWQRTYRLVILTGTEIYQTLYNDDTMGGISWTADENSLAFIASEYKKEEGSDKFQYQDDYGEKYPGNGPPKAFIVDFLEKSINKVDLGSVEPFEVAFSKNVNDLYVIGLDVSKLPRKYGTFACPNRPTGLYLYQQSKLRCLSKGFQSVRKVRVSPNGKRIVFLAGRSGGPHMSGNQLVVLETETGQYRVVVDYVDKPTKDSPFPGLYITTGGLIHRPFISDSVLLVTSVWGFRTTILYIDLENGEVVNITPTPQLSSWRLLDASGHFILAVFSSFTSLPQAMFGCMEVNQLARSDASMHDKRAIPVNKYEPAIEWLSLQKPKSFLQNGQTVFEWLATNIRSEILSLQYEGYDYEAMMIYSSDSSPYNPNMDGAKPLGNQKGTFSDLSQFSDLESPSLLVMAHGGPHVAWTADWSKLIAGLLALANVVLLVNYTGSIGYGQNCVNSLIGKIGDLEVQQTHFAAAQLLDKYPWINRNRVFLVGGSHGGWINAHLSLMYPSFYRGAVLRNPVTDLSLMVAITDIPDWTFYESGLDYDFSKPKLPTLKDHEKFIKISPFSIHIKEGEKYPRTLLVLGAKDRRAPMVNGLRWNEHLISHGLQSRVYVLPEAVHALEGVLREQVNFVLIATFVKENQDKTAQTLL